MRLARDGANDSRIQTIARGLYAMLAERLGRTPTREELVQWLMDAVHLLMDYAPDPPGLEVFQTVQWSIGGECGFSVSPITGNRKGCGDCEDLATLLVCLCLCLGITARVKWIEQKGSPLNHVAALVLFDDQRPDDPRAWRCTDATIPGARVGETPYEALDRVGPGFRSRVFGLSDAAGGVFASHSAPAGLPLQNSLSLAGTRVSIPSPRPNPLAATLSFTAPVAPASPVAPDGTRRPSGRIVVRGAPEGVFPARVVVSGGVAGDPAESQPLAPQPDGTLALTWPINTIGRLQVGTFDVPVSTARDTDSVYDYTPTGLVFRPEITRLLVVAETGRVIVEGVGRDSVQAPTGNSVADNLQHGTRYLVELSAVPPAESLPPQRPGAIFGGIPDALNGTSQPQPERVTIPLSRNAAGAFEGEVMPGPYTVLVFAEESSTAQRQATRRLVYTGSVNVVAGQTVTVTQLDAVADAYGPPGPGPTPPLPIAPSVSPFAVARAASFAAGHAGIVNVTSDGRRNGYLSDASMADPRVPRAVKGLITREFDSIPFDVTSVLGSDAPAAPNNDVRALSGRYVPAAAQAPDAIRLFAVFYKNAGLTFVAMKPSEFTKLLRDLDLLGWSHPRADGSRAFELTV